MPSNETGPAANFSGLGAVEANQTEGGAAAAAAGGQKQADMEKLKQQVMNELLEQI